MNTKRKKIALSLIIVFSLILVLIVWGIVTGKIFSLADLIFGPKEIIVAEKNTLPDFLKTDGNGLLSTDQGLALEKLIVDSKRFNKPEVAPSLPDKRAFPAVATVQDRVWVMGGSADGQTGSTSVYRAKLNRIDSLLSSFDSSSKPLPKPFFAGGGAAVNNFLYYIGGKTANNGLGAYSNKIYANLISLTVDPTTSIDWTWAGDLPTYLAEPGIVVRNEFVYVIGGVSSASADVGSDADLHLSNKVYFSPSETSGVLNQWKETSSLPSPLYRSMPVVIGDRIYLFGGGTTKNGSGDYFAEENSEQSNLTSSDNIYYANINADGTLSAWQSSGKLPQPRQSGYAFFANGYFYTVSGYSYIGREGTENKYRDLQNEIIAAPMDVDDGTIGAWDGSSSGATPSFLAGKEICNGGGVNLSGYMVLVAGEEKLGATRAPTGKVFRAFLANGNDKDLVAGSHKGYPEAAALPEAKFKPEVNAWNGRIYVSGGGHDENGYYGTNTLYYAEPDGDGSISSWDTVTLPQDYFIHQSVILNGYYYLIGGINKSINKVPDKAYKDVYVAKINDDGSLSEFKKTTDLPLPRYQFAAVGSDSTIYILGGIEGDENNYKRVASVYYARQNVDGIIENWQETESLPYAMNDHDATILGRYLYVTGATILNDGVSVVGSVADVYMTEINFDGTLKLFKKVTSLPERRTNLSLVSGAGGIMVYGGFNAFRALVNTALYAPVKRDGTLSYAAWQQIDYPPTDYFASGGMTKLMTKEGKSYLYFVGGYNYLKKIAHEYAVMDNVYYTPLDNELTGGPYSSVAHISGNFALDGKEDIARLVWDIADISEISIPENPSASTRYQTGEDGGPWSDWSATAKASGLDVSQNINHLLFASDVHSSTDRIQTPIVAAYAITKEKKADENGNVNLNNNANLNVNANENSNPAAGPYGGTSLLQNSGRLPSTGASLLLVLIISALVVAIIFLYKEHIKK